MAAHAVTSSPDGQAILDAVVSLPEGAKAKACLQCGTCAATCPTSAVMDYSPRQVMELVRTGLGEEILGTNTIWMCASCYECAVRCPAGIRITDVMYELKRLSLETGRYPAETKVPALSRMFCAVIDRYGRSSEFALLRNYYLRADPLAALKNLPLALKMWRRGRLPLLCKRIKGMDQLRKIDAALFVMQDRHFTAYHMARLRKRRSP